MKGTSFLLLSLFVLSCVSQQFIDNGCHYNLTGFENVASSFFPRDRLPSLLPYNGSVVNYSCPGVQLHFDSSLPCSIGDSGETKGTIINVACEPASELRFQATKSGESCIDVVQLWSKFACTSNEDSIMATASPTPPVNATACVTATYVILQRSPNNQTILISGTTVGAPQFSPDNSICGPETGSTVWFLIKNPSYQIITFSLCSNTSFDSVLYFYKPGKLSLSCYNLICSGYNNDYCGKQSEITNRYNAGNYYLAVAGYKGAVGDFQLKITTEYIPFE